MRLPACGARLTRWERCTPRRAAGTGVCFGVALLCLSACNLGPYYHRPEIPAPAAWASPADAGAPQWPTPDWWRGFASDDLDELIGQAQRANDDLRAAIARVHQADAQRRIAGAPLLPALNLDASATRARAPVQGQTAFMTGNDFSPILSASYELDFWGKNRAALAAATASAKASRYDRTTVELGVMAGVAGTYFLALELRDRLAIANANLANATHVLQGLKLQETAGIATGLDVAQQETVVATVNASIPPLQQQLRQSIDALAILIGSAPEGVDVTHGSLDELSEPPVRPGLPSELLARRPDVAEAEAQLIAANANIAQARATFFPSITLTASGGYESAALAGLLTPANRVWSLGAGALQPIFQGGALVGQYQLAKGHYEELLADYHKAVISALSNVEDSLIAVGQTREQVVRQQQATLTAQRAYEFARAQMRAGTINVLTLLNTETALFSARDALAQAKYAHLQALVSLYQALGGGWQLQQEPA
jgi:outer membrane protein, multidrug efflux system